MMGNEWDYVTGDDNSFEAFERWQDALTEQEDDDEDDV